MFTEFFIKNLDIVFLIYGLAFVVTGVAIWVLPKKESEFRLADVLWLFVAYALIHAPADFFSMHSIMKEETGHIPGQILTSISYLFLFEFGRRLVGFTKKILLWWFLPIIAIGVVISSILSYDFWTSLNILVGYFIRFPAGLMAGVGFFLYYKTQKEKLKPLKVKKYFYAVSASLLAWSFFCGIVRAKGAFFPANWINTDSFLLTARVPVQIFRTICAVITAWGICGTFRIFNEEGIKKLQTEVVERKRAEEELKNTYNELRGTQALLVQSAKMNSVGQLAAGVAHEINNPLFVISGEAEMLLKDAKKDRETKEASRVILEQCGRAKGIIDRLLGFSRPGREVKRQPLDINKVIEESISLLSYQVKIDEIKIIKELTVNLPKPLCDKSQIQEVFLNIMLNAVEAMEKEGELTVKTYSEKITENGRRKIDKFKLGDKIVVIEIKDTGKGMDEETLKKIFNPFFTTKEEGTGLGLYVSYGIIESQGGLIEVQSKLGEGSTFIIKLAIVKEEEGQ